MFSEDKERTTLSQTNNQEQAYSRVTEMLCLEEIDLAAFNLFLSQGWHNNYSVKVSDMKKGLANDSLQWGLNALPFLVYALCINAGWQGGDIALDLFSSYLLVES